MRFYIYIEGRRGCRRSPARAKVKIWAAESLVRIAAFIDLAVTQRLDHAVDGVCNRCANYTSAFHLLSLCYRMHRMHP